MINLEQECRKAFCQKHEITDEHLTILLRDFSLWMMRYDSFRDGFVIGRETVDDGS